MFPTPKGYISIPDAVDRVSRALHGEPETIPWRGKDLDQAVLESGRKQTTQAQEWLIAELSAGRLVVEIDNYEVPTEYWTCYGAHTTAHTGCLQPPEISAWKYAKLAYQPCFIERSAFEERLSKIHGSRGRKPGAGEIDDSAHLDRMADLLRKGTAKSKWNAAGIVAPEAAGSIEVASKQKRLWLKFKKRHA
ncbi:MAG: hypothetical protein O7F75_01060 [Alphaproteobacteria bacterium]|nr:hypothetical protein [Alphaproteobacteria bacterium]